MQARRNNQSINYYYYPQYDNFFFTLDGPRNPELRLRPGKIVQVIRYIDFTF